MTMLSGYSISQLTKQGGQSVQQPDLFFVSQPAFPGLPVQYEYVSKSLKYETFVNKLFTDLSAAFGFGGMIHETSSDYSPAVHSHGYNFFNIEPYEQYDQSKHVVLATFVIDGRRIRIVAPKPFVYKEPDPVIGELKFIATPSIKQLSDIDITSSNFDGWVYPAGQTYYVQCGQFREAKALFGQDPDFNQLRIPDLRDFIKASPAAATQAVHEAGNVVTPRHSHGNVQLYFNTAKTFNVPLSVGICPSKPLGSDKKIWGMMHQGHGGGSTWPRNYTGTIVLSASQAQVTGGTVGSSDAQLARESYPAYNLLPVMIYIGKNVVDEKNAMPSDNSNFTRLFGTDGSEWRINVTELTRTALDFAGGNS